MPLGGLEFDKEMSLRLDSGTIPTSREETETWLLNYVKFSGHLRENK